VPLRFCVLIVEDNPHDVRLTTEALRDARTSSDIHVAQDGAEALAFVRREGAYAGAPEPDLVFLDLNIPKIDGHEVLQAMKADARLRHIPVVVLSSSARDSDVERAYDEQASTYVRKPSDLDQYFTAVRAVKELWFRHAALPSHQPQAFQGRASVP